ncbi:3-phosphoshikimate 1-carboxyvinyltransferase [Candidatus Poribacteria bacterium]|nr:3-phosphoshikimate 1-carboxyvinyltransferase [Candidatus Poribacteria bacterium]
MSNKITIEPQENLSGEIYPPGDKSISHRSVMIGSVSEDITQVENFLTGEDCIATVKAFRKMGVQIDENEPGILTIHGVGINGLHEPDDVLDVGNSGTTMRLISGILAGQPFYSVLTGDDSLRSRPMGRIAKPLRMMGAQVYCRKGEKAPLTIIGGNLNPVEYKTPVASAQIKSCILLAGIYAKGETTVTEPAESRDHTERMLRSFGAEVISSGLNRMIKGRPKLSGHKVIVPGDISSAAYFITAAVLCPGSEVVVRNVGINPTRDGILVALKMMGADISMENQREESGEPVADIRACSSSLQGCDFNGDLIVRMLDEIPLVAVAATQAQGQTKISDAIELRVKETDRISATVSELRNLGAKIAELEDGMVIEGDIELAGGLCKSHGDHRMAMSMTIAGLIADSETTIENINCVDTSFPGFWDMLSSLYR